MNELIDAGDSRAKVVGKHRRVAASIPQRTLGFDRLQQQMGRLWGSLPIPRGVHRFATHEQFETWKTDLMMRNSPARR